MKRGLLYYPMWVNEFDEDPNVLAMSLAEVGLYVLALNESWKRGGIPQHPSDLARLIRRKPADVNKWWPKVCQCWIPGPNGTLVNPRQERERIIAIDKSAKSKEAALVKHANARADADANAHARSDAEGVPRASEYSSTSSSEIKLLAVEKPPGKSRSEKEVLDFRRVWFDEFWESYPRKVSKKAAWEAYRKIVQDAETARVLGLALDRQKPRMLALIEAGTPNLVLHASSWLNGERYEDVIEPPPQLAFKTNAQKAMELV